MLTSDFHYHLPDELVAQHPPPERTDSRLLTLDGSTGYVADRCFREFPSMLRSGDLLVLNDTRVIPARLFARKPSGGRVELLIERTLEGGRALAHGRASKPIRGGSRLLLGEDACVQVTGTHEALVELDFGSEAALAAALSRHGHVPLPPYIRRSANVPDAERYQTVYARHPGAVAAPTAGLHFDEQMLGTLSESGVQTCFITLHVGAGTFQPVRVERLEDHHMHAERVQVPVGTCDAIAAARARRAKVVAVGTTVVRALETAAIEAGSEGGVPRPFAGDSRLFIHPGFRFRVVDSLLTNFHLPGSTLLMLVCAFAGREAVLAAYRHAVARAYRFFSYGDAMLVTRHPGTGLHES